MWNVLSKEMRMPALAAAACAAVILVASPVSAAPPDRDDAAAAVRAYRQYLQTDAVCNFNGKSGKARGNAARCVANHMTDARIAARAAKQKCIDGGGTAKSCQSAVYTYWDGLVP